MSSFTKTPSSQSSKHSFYEKPRLCQISPETQHKEQDRQRRCLSKPKFEIRAVNALREHIDDIKNCGIDDLFDPNNGSSNLFTETIDFCKGQVAVKFSMKILKDGKRVYQSYRDYSDTLRARNKEKVIKAFPTWRHFPNCWPIDVLMSRFINNKKSAEAQRNVTLTDQRADSRFTPQEARPDCNTTINANRRAKEAEIKALRKVQNREAKTAEEALFLIESQLKNTSNTGRFTRKLRAE